nr:IclR family transcriptional regulator [Sedimentibacter sp.]
MEGKNSPTRSVERALEILECFLDHKELTLSQISEKTNLSPSTAHRIISTLQSKHFLERDTGSKKIFLGNKINQLSTKLPNDTHDELKKVSYRHMLKLNEKYNENVRLFILDGEYKLCIAVVESTRSLRQIIRIGERHLLVSGAAGKIFLAYMDAGRRNEIIKDTRLNDLDFEKIIEKGYALSIGEREEGLVGIASPIKNEHGKTVAVLSFSGPSVRFVNEEMTDKINDTIKTANDISRDLGYKIN